MFKRFIDEATKAPISATFGLIGFILIVVSIGVSWQRLGTPEQTDVTNNHYTNNSQWQATVVFPNRGIPLEIEHFNYQIPNQGSVTFQADTMRKELSDRCLWWIPTTTATYRILIISCFKEKKPKYTKTTELPKKE